jgi:nitrogen fixation/metabolism regulation signal transduction histidine kinase
MKESVERQDSAALFALLGAREKALTQLREHRARFDQNLRKAANNITEPGETAAIASISNDHDLYYGRFDKFIVKPTADDYFAQLEPQFNKLRGDCEHLLQLNQRAMLGKAEAAAGVAQLWFYRTLLIAGVLVAVGLALAFLLAQQIVGPLQRLTESTARIAGGDLGARVEIDSHDEVGVLAAEYNRMAENLRQLRDSDLGKLLVAQQTTEAAIDSLYDPVIVTDADGHVTKLNPAAEEIFGS